MLLKLTNAHPDHKGKQLILNTELILSFYEGVNEENENVVFAYGMNNNTWQLSDTIEEIMEQANSIQ